MKKMKKIFQLIYFLLLILTINIAKADLIKGKDYSILINEIPQLDPSKIEVLEFFSFICIHCYDLQPILSKESKKFLDDTYLRKIHVVWNDTYLQFARLAYAVSKSGADDKATNAIFKATFEDNINLVIPENLKDWLKTQKNWNTQALEQAYNSNNSLLAANKMKQLTNKYGILGTPIIIVGGKYQLIFSNSYEKSMIKLNQLVEKVRKEKNIQLIEQKNNFIPSIGQKITISVI